MIVKELYHYRKDFSHSLMTHFKWHIIVDDDDDNDNDDADFLLFKD